MCHRRHFLLAFLSAAAVPVFANQGKGKGRGKGQGRAGETRFTRGEITVIVDYYRGPGGLPPGLAKRGGDLPPGLQKQLRRNGRLPPGLEKRLVPFPPDLEGRLAPVCGGCRRVTLGGWALLINDVSNVILDVIELRR